MPRATQPERGRARTGKQVCWFHLGSCHLLLSLTGPGEVSKDMWGQNSRGSQACLWHILARSLVGSSGFSPAVGQAKPALGEAYPYYKPWEMRPLCQPILP